MKTRTILNGLLLATVILFTNVVSAHNGEGDEPSKKEDKVQIITSELNFGNATIKWADSRIDFVEITSTNGQFMPAIPVLDATSLHLNDLISGTYTINFISNGQTLYSKNIRVQR
ncbi:MAG: hypothetical protein FJZ67_01975 [Bacteroidetes bacterium]|nr:hypothetical protein [Bacteroidota bacterium]